ncbi:MAG: hypothetical protein ACR2L1_05575 [Pyrinomonadaceae bacterium]
MKNSVALFLILFGGFVLQVSTQTLLVNDKIPEDLLITVKRQGGWGGNYSEINITADGDFSFETRGGLPKVPTPNLYPVNEKPPKYLKPKLSAEKLKLLIAEFEKIQFFKFSKDFPTEDEKEVGCVTDQGTDVISIQINGQTKEVSNYLGCSGKRNRLLRDLAEKIRGAGIWNYENDEIPDNFEVWYRITDGDRIQKDFKINAKGKITETVHASRFYPEVGKELPIRIKSKTVGKLSKPQLRQLVDEFEKTVFSTFKYSPLTKYAGCSNDSVPTAEKRTHISVQINRVQQMYASLYANCNPKPETDAAKFEYISVVIKELLKNAGIAKIN